MTLCTLRPQVADDWALLDQLANDESCSGHFQWFGYRTLTAERRKYEHTGLLTADGGALGVVDPVGLLVGRVDWFRSAWGPVASSWCWSIAVAIAADQRGRGFGTASQRQLTDYLFAHTRAQRVQAWTDIQNEIEQRALLSAGFEREGVLRAAQWRAGAWHDQVLYSRLRCPSP